MARTGMAPKIFLAHAREDKERVRQLYFDLRDRGLDPWLDEIDLIPGTIWKPEISKAIREAGVFLACLSSRSVEKVGFVQSEFRIALSAYGDRPAGSIYLIPVRLDDCEIPDLQIPDRGLSLQDIQWVDLRSEGGLDRLVGAIEHAFERISSSPPEAREDAPPAVVAGEHGACSQREVAHTTDSVARDAQAERSTRSEFRFGWHVLRYPSLVWGVVAVAAVVASAVWQFDRTEFPFATTSSSNQQGEADAELEPAAPPSMLDPSGSPPEAPVPSAGESEPNKETADNAITSLRGADELQTGIAPEQEAVAQMGDQLFEPATDSQKIPDSVRPEKPKVIDHDEVYDFFWTLFFASSWEV